MGVEAVAVATQADTAKIRRRQTLALGSVARKPEHIRFVGDAGIIVEQRGNGVACRSTVLNGRRFRAGCQVPKIRWVNPEFLGRAEREKLESELIQTGADGFLKDVIAESAFIQPR